MELPLSGHKETRMPESPSFSSRVQNYNSDNVFARLSCDTYNFQGTAQDREKAMRAFLDNLARAIEGRTEKKKAGVFLRGGSPRRSMSSCTIEELVG